VLLAVVVCSIKSPKHSNNIGNSTWWSLCILFEAN